VARAARYPALCTQAALAPPCEWLLHNGYVACEPRGGAGRAGSRHAMEVDVTARGGGVRARKRLCVRPWEAVRGDDAGTRGRRGGGAREGVDVVVEVMTGSTRSEDALLVTVTPCDRTH
jgi:hypothetical protein